VCVVFSTLVERLSHFVTTQLSEAQGREGGLAPALLSDPGELLLLTTPANLGVPETHPVTTLFAQQLPVKRHLIHAFIHPRR
jgi:hypothetical protein